jgi:hypothetical protein
MIIYLNSSDFSRQFFIVYFTSKYWCHSTLPTNLPWILIYLYYKYSCTAHYSSATFWIWFCLDLIKVIALAHLAIISTKLKRIRIDCSWLTFLTTCARWFPVRDPRKPCTRSSRPACSPRTSCCTTPGVDFMNPFRLHFTDKTPTKYTFTYVCNFSHIKSDNVIRYIICASHTFSLKSCPVF